MMERFSKAVNGFWPLTIYAKHFVLDVWQWFEYVSTSQFISFAAYPAIL